MAQSNTPSRTSANDEAHWRKTTNLMLIHLGIWVFFGYIVHMFVKPLNNIVIPVVDFPLGFYMAAQGSLIVFVVQLFLFAKQQNKIDREFAAKIGRAPFNSLIDHFDHVIKVAGIDHVGIGTDFDGIPVPPEGIDSAADLPKVTAALMARGYTAEDMQKLLGGNLLRVMRAVEAASDHKP